MSQEEDTSFSRTAIEKELADRTDDELLEMAKRLSRGTEGLNQVMADLEVEKEQLREEKEHLHKTIDLMMQEMRKLNIGSDNTVEPQLEEGPLDFVGRFWEKMKPRDNTYLVSDNVGELRKISEPGEDKEEIRRHVEKKAKEVGQQLQGALGPLWSRAEGLLSAAQEELASQVAAQRERRQDGGSTPNGHGRERASSGSAGYAGFASFGSLLAKGQELLEGRRGQGGQQSAGGSSSSGAGPSAAPAAPAAPAAQAAPAAAAAPAAETAPKKEVPLEVPKEAPKKSVEGGRGGRFCRGADIIHCAHRGLHKT